MHSGRPSAALPCLPSPAPPALPGTAKCLQFFSSSESHQLKREPWENISVAARRTAPLIRGVRQWNTKSTSLKRARSFATTSLFRDYIIKLAEAAGAKPFSPTSRPPRQRSAARSASPQVAGGSRREGRPPIRRGGGSLLSVAAGAGGARSRRSQEQRAVTARQEIMAAKQSVFHLRAGAWHGVVGGGGTGERRKGLLRAAWLEPVLNPAPHPT